MNKISVYIIAYNEAEKIKAAIKSVQWADEIIVADSYSTDDTSKIAESLGAKVIQIPFNGFGELRNKAMAACKYNWIFSLDSDERCTAVAKEEILKITSSKTALDAYYVPRKNFFMGKWIKHSGYYPDYRQPQLFRKETMSFLHEPVHETFKLHTEKIGYLKNPIYQIPFKDFEQIIHKANRYSTLGAEKMLQLKKRKPSMATAFFHGLWAFLHHFIIKAGFMDGWAGFVIAFGNFEGTFYKYAKLHERMSNWKSLNDKVG